MIERKDRLMSLLTINKLTSSVGAEVLDIEPDQLAADDSVGAAVLTALEDNGVLVFRGLQLDPRAQVAFCGQLGHVDYAWEPFFTGNPADPRNGTEEIITSAVSKART